MCIRDRFAPDDSAQVPPVHKNLGRSSMSPLTALALSFNNLLTKKTRTLLTAVAGSIGIIGIALILSLSAGLSNYIPVSYTHLDVYKRQPFACQTLSCY